MKLLKNTIWVAILLSTGTMGAYLTAPTWTALPLRAGGLNAPTLPQPSEPSLDELIREAGAATGVDPLLLKAVVRQESRFNPDAVGDLVSTTRSRLPVSLGSKREMLARAHGLMGVMGSEAEKRGIPWYNLYKKSINLFVGGTMLCDCINSSKATDRLDKISQGLSCYYSGSHTISDRRPTPSQPSPREYVSSVLFWYLKYKV